MGIADAFMAIGQLEFFYDQAPESIRSISMAWYYSLISVGSYLSYIVVTVMHRFSARPKGSNWLPDDHLNTVELGYF